MRIDKTRIRSSFAKASSTYDSVAQLQRTVGNALLSACALNANPVNTVLDLGCGTGFLTGALSRELKPEALIALDIAFSMLQTTRAKVSSETSLHPVCADAEHLPFIAHSIDQVFSNLALQWCRNLEVVFLDLRRVLKPEGRLVFSTFGPQTLQELKSAWACVDNYSHVNSFYDHTQLQQFLRNAGFTDIQLTRTLYTSYYPTVKSLMQELKHLGAQQVLTGRNKTITTKTALHKMFAAYEDYRVNGQILATFEVLSVSAQA